MKGRPAYLNLRSYDHDYLQIWNINRSDGVLEAPRLQVVHPLPRTSPIGWNEQSFVACGRLQSRSCPDFCLAEPLQGNSRTISTRILLFSLQPSHIRASCDNSTARLPLIESAVHLVIVVEQLLPVSPYLLFVRAVNITAHYHHSSLTTAPHTTQTYKSILHLVFYCCVRTKSCCTLASSAYRPQNIHAFLPAITVSIL